MYKEADMTLWRGRVDDPSNGSGSLRWHQCVTPYTETVEKGVVLVGIASDEGVKRNQGRTGAGEGPDCIRQALANQAFHLRRQVYDGGNLCCEEDRLEELQHEQAAMITKLLDRGHFPLLLGGGHELAFGNFVGLQQHLAASGNNGSIGIINFDAHFDLRRDCVPTSGTSFLQMADYCASKHIPFQYLCLGINEVANTGTLFDKAEQLGVTYIKDEEIDNRQLPDVEEKIKDFLATCSALYLSIDLDVLPAATAPGVSAPAARGVALPELERLLSLIRSTTGTYLKLADIAEYNPNYDIDMRTAKVAARLCHLLTR